MRSCAAAQRQEAAQILFIAPTNVTNVSKAGNQQHASAE